MLNNAVSALQLCTAKYLNTISGGELTLKFALQEGDERIARRILVRTDAASTSGRPQVVERSLSSLSGGQWRRCALALNLGFAELCARRGRLQSSLLVLDEPLTHLDPVGRAKVGGLLKSMVTRGPQDRLGGHLRGTIAVILQGIAAEEMNDIFDHIDDVQREGGRSRVHVDGL